MSESRMWDHLRTKMAGRLHMRRLTDRIEKGVPDVTYTDQANRAGKLELKYVYSLPSRKDSPRFSLANVDLRREQAMWAQQWVAGGGVAGVLLRVGKTDEWMYWRAQAVPDWVNWILSPAAMQEDNTDLWLPNLTAMCNIEALYAELARLRR